MRGFLYFLLITAGFTSSTYAASCQCNRVDFETAAENHDAVIIEGRVERSTLVVRPEEKAGKVFRQTYRRYFMKIGRRIKSRKQLAAVVGIDTHVNLPCSLKLKAGQDYLVVAEQTTYGIFANSCSYTALRGSPKYLKYKEELLFLRDDWLSSPR